MEILFTTSMYPASRLILAVTQEPVSHCALRYGNLVLHTTFTGFNITTLSEFTKHSTIVYRLETGHPTFCADILETIRANLGKSYDWMAFFSIGIRALAKALGLPFWKIPLRNISGINICTEFVAETVFGKRDLLLTPYQLYQKLNKKV